MGVGGEGGPYGVVNDPLDGDEDPEGGNHDGRLREWDGLLLGFELY